MSEEDVELNAGANKIDSYDINEKFNSDAGVDDTKVVAGLTPTHGHSGSTRATADAGNDQLESCATPPTANSSSQPEQNNLLSINGQHTAATDQQLAPCTTTEQSNCMRMVATEESTVDVTLGDSSSHGRDDPSSAREYNGAGVNGTCVNGTFVEVHGTHPLVEAQQQTVIPTESVMDAHNKEMQSTTAHDHMLSAVPASSMKDEGHQHTTPVPDLDDDEEPLVDYDRIILPELNELISSDRLTTFAATSRRLVLGTMLGKVTVIELHPSSQNQSQQVAQHSAPGGVGSTATGPDPSTVEELNSNGGTASASTKPSPVLTPTIRTGFTHRDRVNDLSLDENEAYVASCSSDGKVAVFALNEIINATPWITSHNVPLLSVAIHPKYSNTELHRKAVCVGTATGVLLCTHGGTFFSSSSELHSGEGPVFAVRWKQSVIAWANLRGVKLLDVDTCQKIAHIPHPSSNVPPNISSLSGSTPGKLAVERPHLLWASRSHLLVGWGTLVQVAVMHSELLSTYSDDVTLYKGFDRRILGGGYSTTEVTLAEVRYEFTLPGVVCGVAPFEWQQDDKSHTGGSTHKNLENDDGLRVGGQSLVSVAVLTSPSFEMLKNNTADEELTEAAVYNAPSDSCPSTLPQLHIVGVDGHIRISDALPLKGLKGCHPSDFLLVFGTMALPLFVISPADFLQVKRRDDFDHIQWLMSRGQYETALTEARRCSEPVHRAVANAAISDLFESGQYCRAAEIISAVGMPSRPQWEACIVNYASKGVLMELALTLPPPHAEVNSDDGCSNLNFGVYESILYRTALSDPSTLAQLNRLWALRVLNIDKVLDRLHKNAFGEAFVVCTGTPLALVESYRAPFRRRVETRSRSTSSKFSVMSLEVAAQICEATRRLAQALAAYLRLRNPRIYSILQMHVNHDAYLRETARVCILQIFEVDTERSISELITAPRCIFPVGDVAPALLNSRLLLHRVLKEYFFIEPETTSRYHQLQVSLFATFEPQLLSMFLSHPGNTYDANLALESCRQASAALQSQTLETARDHLQLAEAYLLEKLGHFSDALQILLERLQDVPRAVMLVSENKNCTALWAVLVDYSLSRPHILAELLNVVGTRTGPNSFLGGAGETRRTTSSFGLPVGPLQILKRLRHGELSRIPNVQTKLAAIFGDFKVQLAVDGELQNIQADEKMNCERRKFLLRNGGRNCYTSILPHNSSTSMTLLSGPPKGFWLCFSDPYSVATALDALEVTKHNLRRRRTTVAVTSQPGELILAAERSKPPPPMRTTSLVAAEAISWLSSGPARQWPTTMASTPLDLGGATKEAEEECNNADGAYDVLCAFLSLVESSMDEPSSEGINMEF
eukprot:Lankesteria_metandrocarpae@DN6035_c0_g1_i1.p1